jgi:hypothetical protein
VVSGADWRTAEEPSFDLTVAIRAYEDALQCLLAVCGEGLPVTRVDPEALGGGIDVMEVEADRAPVVAADHTTSTRLDAEYRLDLLMPARDRLPDASFASPTKAAFSRLIAVESRRPVASTVANLRGAPLGGRSPRLRDKWHRCFDMGTPASSHECMFA